MVQQCSSINFCKYVLYFKVLILYYLAFKHHGIDFGYLGVSGHHWILPVETFGTKAEEERTGAEKRGYVQPEPSTNPG